MGKGDEPMRILFVNPDLPSDAPMGRLPSTIHVGLSLVAGACERRGHTVAIYDDYLEHGRPDLFDQRMRDFAPDAVAITANLAILSTTTALARQAKASGIPVVIGGPEATVHPEQTLRRTGGDYAVIGEGEETMPELCATLAGATDAPALEDVAGVAFASNGGEVVLNAARPPLTDMDEIPFVPLHLYPLERYGRFGNEVGATPCDVLSTSRGCPFRCAFCSNKHVWGRRYRFMSAPRIVAEVVAMQENYGTTAINFREDHFTLNRRRVMEFCRLMIELQTGVVWACESRTDCLDDELLALMKKAGCRAIWFGVESGTQRVLDMLKKGTNLEQIESTFRRVKSHGIAAGASVILGIPGQTMEENRETIRFVRRLDPEWVYFNTFLGLPGSEMYQEILDRGLVWQEWEGLILPNSEIMTWPEKQAFKRRAELLFNVRPKMLRRHLRRMGLRGFVRKSFNALSRYVDAIRYESRGEDSACSCQHE